MPAPLPPEKAVRLEGELLTLLSQADRALGRLDGSIQTLPHPDLYRHPIVAVTETRDLIQTSYPAANNLITQFVTHGVLHEMTGQKRNRRFIYRDYTKLFHDDEERSEAP